MVGRAVLAILTLVALVALWFAPATAAPSQLWDKVNAGMSNAEVKALYPTAKLARDGDLALDDPQHHNMPLVMFKFKDDRLNEVLVGYLTPNIDEIYAARKDALTQKFGAPKSEDARNFGKGTFAQATFSDDGKTIKLTKLGGPPGFSASVMEDYLPVLSSSPP